jgi:hypothetical protein
MSAAIAKQYTIIPAFNLLVADVTPKIVQSLRSPSMRSLSQTSKSWNNYLKEVWHLNERNYRYSARIIYQHRTPSLCFLDMAERLADVSPPQSLELINTVLPQFKRLSDSSRNSLMTLLSLRTGMALSGSLQASLAGAKGWDCGTESDEENVKAMVSRCFSPTKGEYIPFHDLLRVCIDLPDRLKTVAFVALMSELCNRQGFNDDDGAFWQNKGQRRVFRTLLPRLIPETWSSCLKSSGNIFGLTHTIMNTGSSFGMAVEACLRKFRSSVPELSYAVLRLVKSSARDLEPKKQNWNGVSKYLLNQKMYSERKLIRNLMYAVFLWGVVDNENVNQACKKMLCDSGFLTKLQWSSLKSDARSWYVLTKY